MKNALLTFSLFTFTFSLSLSAATIFVSPEGTSGSGGASWADAKDLKSALTSADVTDGRYFTSDAVFGEIDCHIRGKRGFLDETTGEMRFVVPEGGESAAISLKRNLGYYGEGPNRTLRYTGGMMIFLR